jgi:tetratricopeptide (TPR) repeat protein
LFDEPDPTPAPALGTATPVPPRIERAPDSSRTMAFDVAPPPSAKRSDPPAAPAAAPVIPSPPSTKQGLPVFFDKAADDAQTRAFTLDDLAAAAADEDGDETRDPPFFDRAPVEGRTRTLTVEELAASGEVGAGRDEETVTRLDEGVRTPEPSRPSLPRPRMSSEPTLAGDSRDFLERAEATETGAFKRPEEPAPESSRSTTSTFGRAELAAPSAPAAPGRPPAAAAPAPPPPPPLEPLALESSTGGFVPRSEVFRPPPTFENERPAHAWLDGSALEALRDRATWLEEEARALEDDEERARALLAVSELRAIADETDMAVSLAAEARQLAPHLPLTWAQTRGLTSPRAPHALEELDAEVPHARTAAARVHVTLLAADVARTSGDMDGAIERWEQAKKLEPLDIRAPLARAAVALGMREHTNPALRLSEVREHEPVDQAIGHLLGLRGAPHTERLPDVLLPNDALRRLRHFLSAQDFPSAQATTAEIGRVAGLTKAAAWLSSAFGALSTSTRKSSQKTLKTLADAGDRQARRAHAARSLELSDPEGLLASLADTEAFGPEERAILTALAGGDAREGNLTDALDPTLAPLAAGIAGATFPAAERSRHLAGDVPVRAKVRLARLAASRADDARLSEAHGDLGEPTAFEDAVVAQRALFEGKSADVAMLLARLAAGAEGANDRARDRQLVRALVAESSGDATQAKIAMHAARELAGPFEAMVRLDLATDPTLEPAPELLATAEAMEPQVPAALLRLEALAREDLPDATRAAELARAHEAGASLGIAAFLAERVARRAGDEEEVLKWTRERRTISEDALELALDGVRESWLVADHDPQGATARLVEAHEAFPRDVALRELYERLDPHAAKAAWRDAQAEASSGETRALFASQAAFEHALARENTAALASAKVAAQATASGGPAARGPVDVLLDRLEIASGEVSRLTDGLLELARASQDATERREAYERLAELDWVGRKDRASAILWHRSVLEENPAHLPSLRYLEHALVGAGRDDELEPVHSAIAHTLGRESPGETSSHAYAAIDLRTRNPEQGFDAAFDLVKLAYEAAPSLWATRAMYAQARAKKDDALTLEVLGKLIEDSTRMPETAALLVRASEAAARLGAPAEARALLERAASTDPGDVLTWGFLAEVRAHAEDLRAAAEACESQARTSVVPAHQLVAWYDAARTWLEVLKDEERGVLALEQAAMIDASFSDVFSRLFALYTAQKKDAALAELLESRLTKVDDPDERVALEVQLGMALAEMGDTEKAREVLQRALDQRPEQKDALFALAGILAKESDHEAAEKAYVSLSRLVLEPEEAKRVFEALADLYAGPLANLSRAEVALKEVLKRFPEDLASLEKLVAVHRRQNDVSRAVEVKQQVVSLAKTPEERLARLVELAQIHETTGRDPRKAEQTLEAARKEFPLSVVALRALAEFFARHNQMPAMHVLLDRAASDARRAFAGGRFVTSLFETLATAYELRGKADAARVVSATLSAISGQPAELRGAELAAGSPELDDLLAPDVMSPALRALLARAGDGLDRAHPMDLNALAPTPLPATSPLAPLIQGAASAMGISGLMVLVSAKAGQVAIPATSTPPTLVVGEKLLESGNDRARAFQIVRALKLLSLRASALVRGKSEEVNALVSAWLSLFNPSWKPANVPPGLLQDMQRKLAPTMPAPDPNLGVTALEAAGLLGTSGPQLRAAAMGWANRVALLAVGDPNAALDAIAWSLREERAPTGTEERPAWVARQAEARDLMTFSVSDAYAEARNRLGL